jgi:fermentation-respiration switch protein FrsA (DUF1100 family)
MAAAEPQARTKKPMSRRVRWAVRVAVLMILLGVLKFVGLDCKFYYPDDRLYDAPEEFGLRYEDVRFETEDGLTLAGWFFPAAGDPKGTVVHFHGNAANVTGHLGLVEWVPTSGYHLLMFDYRGYGKSEGSVTRAGTIRDGHAAITYALSRPETKGLPLFAYGQSLGGAVAIVVAAERPEIAAVVAESTFSGYRKIATLVARSLVGFDALARPLVGWSISSGYDPIDVVTQLAPRPLLVIAAEHDQTCPPELARELYDAASEPKEWWLVPKAGHLGILMNHREELIDRITAFLDKAASNPPHSREGTGSVKP